MKLTFVIVRVDTSGREQPTRKRTVTFELDQFQVAALRLVEQPGYEESIAECFLEAETPR